MRTRTIESKQSNERKQEDCFKASVTYLSSTALSLAFTFHALLFLLASLMECLVPHTQVIGTYHTWPEGQTLPSLLYFVSIHSFYMMASAKR